MIHKFRIWDAEAECYSYSTDEPSNPSRDGEYYWGFENGEMVAYVCVTETPSDIHEAPYPSSNKIEGEIETYTGRTDMNGVEIYEGSIVKVDWDDGETEVYSIDWEEWGFCTYDGALLPECEQIEVIGNIHESPELLEVK